MTRGLFDRRRLLSVVRDFVFFPDASRKEVEIVPRYPQFYAAAKLYENVLTHRRPEGDGKGGTYFGATGCGKSYTMLFLSRLLMRSVELASPTLVLTTDRTDLDDQLSATFVSAKSYIGDGGIVSVDSRAELRQHLEGKRSGGVFLIADALHSDGVEEILRLGDDAAGELDLFDPDYLDKIDRIKLPNTRIKLLQQLLAKAISDLRKLNRAKGVDFSRKFQALVDEYNERDEDSVLVSNVLEDFGDAMVDMIMEMRAERGAHEDLGIDAEEKAFHDILLSLARKYDFHYPEDKLVALAKAVKALVDDVASYTDWNRREDIKAGLRAHLIMLLAKHGYPPVGRDEVYKEIFERAENFKRQREG